jgi:PPOX class probable F420-dependent enzyme
VRPDGRPHVVVCCFAVDGDVAYSAVDGKPKTTTDLQRLRNVAADERASLLVDHYDDDWTQLWWVRADGRARAVHGGHERDRAVGLLVAKYHQYGADPPTGPVLALEVDRWSSWSA